MSRLMNLGICLVGTLLALAAAVYPAAAQSSSSGTTLAAVKTIDICDAGGGLWTYSGEIAVWNQGAVDTIGLSITDCIQYKLNTSKKDPQDVGINYCVVPPGSVGAIIPAGTTAGTATTFSYSITQPPLDPVVGTIRNHALLTILNHSGSIGKPKGPDVKATWTGGTPPPCNQAGQCTFSQGYWKNHSDQWPVGSDPNATFFLSGTTWLGQLGNPGGNGYNILAVQYIGAILNQLNGANVPAGIQDVLNQATAWLNINDPSVCTSPGSCGTQKDWGKILEAYNLGTYPGSPGHCSE
jgi:hypothetical protein